MQRAQRGTDNPALNTAIRAANALDVPIAVFMGLARGYPDANRRHYRFLLEGLADTARRVAARNAAFVLRADPDHSLLKFCEEVRPCLVVGDENRLRAQAGWRDSAARKLKVPFWTVDADVVVPSRLLPKEEYAARTIRPKIHRLLDEHLRAPGNPKARAGWKRGKAPATLPVPDSPAGIDSLLDDLKPPAAAQPVAGYRGGTDEAMRRLRRFVRTRLPRYHLDRNRADLPGTSELSAHLHFGHIGPHTVALAVARSGAPRAAREAFLEELIVRRELAVNFVARNPAYDRLEGSPDWARRTLSEQAGDDRPILYSDRQLEQAETGDPIWNAAQREMVGTGRMHGYLRMYWAKKILQWSETPEQAFERAVRLNDRYEMDGRDPNGYTGVAWSIGGKHDRPWGPRRPVFGLIRYMADSGIRRKMDVDAYIEKVEREAG